VDHEPGLALAEQEVADRLLVSSCRVSPMKIDMGSMASLMKAIVFAMATAP
jgi:hypothetical protein